MIARCRPALQPAFFLAHAFSIIWASTAQAKTTTIDDSGTQALEPSVSLRWKTVRPSRSDADNLMVGTTTIRVRINLLPWLRRSGRIYLNLPAQQPGPIAASWITQGRFLAGQVHSGNRMLVYTGPITTPFMEDVLKFQFSVDGTLIRRAFPVTFHFEMDED
jgi:predicted small secreted protein